MKKIAALLFIVLFTSSSLFAQGMGAGVQGGVALPMGDFGDMVSTGFGGQGNFVFNVNKNLGITGSIGYYTFGTNSDFDIILKDYSFSTIPVLVGARYCFTQKNFKPYVAAELGMFFSSFSYTYASEWSIFLESESDQEVSDSGSDFGYVFGAGFMLPIGKKADLDVSVKYNTISSDGTSLNYITIVVGAMFALGK